MASATLNGSGRLAFKLNVTGRRVIVQNTPLSIGFADIAFEGFALSITHAANVQFGFADIAFEGFPLVISSPGSVSIGFADISFEGFALSISHPEQVAFGFADIAFEGFALSISHPTGVEIGFADIVFEGFPLVLTHPESVSIGFADISFDGFALSITPGSPPVTVDYLSDRLTEWWDGENAVGEHQAITLIAANSPTHVAAKCGNGFQAHPNSGGGHWKLNNVDAGAFKMGLGGYSKVFWIKPSSADGGHRGTVSFGGDPAGARQGLDIRTTSNGTGILAFFYDGTTSYALSLGSSLTADAFNHVAAVIDRQNFLIYVNGLLVGSVDISAAAAIDIQPTVEFRIGKTDQNQLSSNLMDEVSIWNVGLPQDLVMFLYKAGACRSYSEISSPPVPFVAHRYFRVSTDNEGESITSVNGSGEWKAGDLIIVKAAIDGNQTVSGVTCDITGASQAWISVSTVGSDIVTSVCFYKQLVAGDLSKTSVNVDWSDSNEKSTVEILRIPAGVHNGIDGVPSANPQGTSTSPQSPSITTSVANSMVLNFLSSDASPTITKPTGTGLIKTHQAAAGGHVSSSVCAFWPGVAGATGAKTWSLSSGRSVVCGTLAVKGVV